MAFEKLPAMTCLNEVRGKGYSYSCNSRSHFQLLGEILYEDQIRIVEAEAARRKIHPDAIAIRLGFVYEDNGNFPGNIANVEVTGITAEGREKLILCKDSPLKSDLQKWQDRANWVEKGDEDWQDDDYLTHVLKYKL